MAPGGGSGADAAAQPRAPSEPRPTPPRRHESLFTSGPLLAAVQRARLFEDSKTFVDMPLRCAPAVALAAFHALPPAAASDTVDAFGVAAPDSCAPPLPHAPRAPSREALSAFVAAHFGAPGAELTPRAPADWTTTLPWLEGLPPDAAALARDVHARWALLGRAAADTADARSDSDGEEAEGAEEEAHARAAASSPAAPAAPRLPSRRTALRLPRPCVVPGDRFREVYYWDSYWVVRGLLASQLPGAAADAVRNLLSLAAATRPASGHVPNGARTYYLGRSQPPLLARTLAAVHAATGDGTLVRDALPVLRDEWRYYTSGRHAVRVSGAADGRVHALSRYWAGTAAPRPESWREDAAAAEGLPAEAAAALWRNIASAAESGWDFSTRWLGGSEAEEEEGAEAEAVEAPPAAEAPPPAAAAAALRALRTVRVVPADLNALLADAARTAARLADAVGDAEAAAFFRAAGDERAAALEALLWDDDGAQWRDLILDPSPAEDEEEEADTAAAHAHAPPRRGRRSRRAFASNWIPLWCDCAVTADADADAGAAVARGERAAASLAASGLVLPGGVAASLSHSGQQWDYPNAWPPLQHMLVEGLDRCGGATAAALAERIAGAYLRAAAAGLRGRHGVMHEKYDARVGAGAGAGAEEEEGAARAGGGGEYAPQVGFGWSNGVALALLRRYGRIPA
jgi:alpha,alpha-trehalase